MLSTTIDPMLDNFVKQLEKDVPCYSHKRLKGKDICLKKCNSMVRGKMGQIAEMRNRSTKGDFRISVKDSLVDNWCRSQGIVVRDTYGLYAVLLIYVKHNGAPRSADYHIAVEVLQRAMRHHSLPPYPSQATSRRQPA